ncbi:hypothetical protein AO239_27330 [Pseudomonas sp. ICMP 19500]|nr:hypothetical protein AO239_27330 [Pseudomonas sp. ICMP 19500]
MFGQAYKVQAWNMNGSPVALRHSSLLIHYWKALEKWQVRTIASGKNQAINGFMLPFGPNNAC